MTKKEAAWGTECPECGDMMTRALNSGHDENNRRIRYRSCMGCGHRFTTIELVVPGLSFHAAVATKRGHHDLRQNARRALDQVKVEDGPQGSLIVRVVRGRWLNRCRKGLHRLVGDNVYVNPSTGQRTCRACRREAAKALYHHTRAHMPPALLEEYRAKERNRKRAAYKAKWARGKYVGDPVWREKRLAANREYMRRKRAAQRQAQETAA